MMNNKKAQVTVFVIIGIILLVTAGLFFYLNSSLTDDKPGLEIVDVSLERGPAFELVKDCLEEVSEEGLKKISNQGGWLEFPGMTYSDLPYESDIVEFTPYKVAYWRHLKECGNGFCEESHQPPLCKPGSEQSCFSSKVGDYSIQEQLENYIDENIITCLNNFESLENQFDIEIIKEPTSSVFFLNGETRVLLNYPMQLKSFKNDNKVSMDEFDALLDIDMVGLYELANQILWFEKEIDFYEYQTLNLITIYSGINEPLPPTSDVRFFDFAPKFWIQQQVKDILQYDLLPFMGTIRYMNAKNYYPLEDFSNNEYTKYANGLYMGMNPKLGTSNQLYDFNIVHHYLYTPIYSKVGNGESLIKPTNLEVEDDIVLKMAGLFLKDYRFRYDIRYPLIVEVSDDEALNGKGFSLNFALEVNINNNIPGYGNFTKLDFPVPFKTGLGDFEVRPSQNVTINTKNKYTSEVLDDVMVSYICGREHEIGVTKLNSKGDAQLISTLPYCEMGGYLKFTKAGYEGTTIEYDNKLNGSNKIFYVDLWPMKEKELIIYKRTVEDIHQLDLAGTGLMIQYMSALHNITDNESVLFNINKIKEKPYDPEIPLIGFVKYQTPGYKIYPDEVNQDINISLETIEKAYQEGTIDGEMYSLLVADFKKYEEITNVVEEAQDRYSVEIAPGRYDIDAMLFNFNGIYVPQDWIDPCEGDIIQELFCDEDLIELPAQNFSNWMTGGIKTELVISPADLYNERPLIFFVLEMPIPQSWDDLSSLKTIEEYQENYLTYAIPRT